MLLFADFNKPLDNSSDCAAHGPVDGAQGDVSAEVEQISTDEGNGGRRLRRILKTDDEVLEALHSSLREDGDVVSDGVIIAYASFEEPTAVGAYYGKLTHTLGHLW